MGRHLDLDAIRAARLERAGEGPTVTLFGDTYTLPPELPFVVLDAFATGDAVQVRRAVIALIGEEGLDKVLANGGTRDDMEELCVLAAQTLYGVSPEA